MTHGPNNQAVGKGADPRTFVDVHCHCLPRLDDGPASMAQSLALCRALLADGVSCVVATPHQLGRYEGRNEAGPVRQAVSQLNAALREHDLPLQVLAGGDVRLDERILELIQADRILTLADGGRYLLLELPHDVFIDPSHLIAGLASHGVGTILSHPERNTFVIGRLQMIPAWLHLGASLQITAASLLGSLGQPACQGAWHVLRRGWVSLVASDSHDRVARPPRLRSAFAEVARRLGVAVANRLFADNPARVVAGEDLLPVDGSMAQEICQ